MPARTVAELAPESLLVGTSALIVSFAWNGFFNNLFDYIADTSFAQQDGPRELALRFTYAIAMTFMTIYLVRRYLMK